METFDDGSTSIDYDIHDIDYNRLSQMAIARPSVSSISSNGTSTTTNNGMKRPKDLPPCYVCGAEAYGYNFDQSNKTRKLADFY
jgi:hypothetical protein